MTLRSSLYWNRGLNLIMALTLLLIYGLLLAHPINLVTADLGRHIKNGQLILENFQIAQTNLYSYTHPDYPSLNHHWLSGVIFFLIWRAFDFIGVHIFFLILSLATLALFFRLAQKRAGYGLAALMGLLIIPLLLERSEIRPEIFSYFFSAIFFWLLTRFKTPNVASNTECLMSNKMKWRILLILPLLEIVWVNLHIYFFLGPVIIGVFLIESLIVKNQFLAKKLGLILSLTVLAGLINPVSLKGLLEPLNIFKNYGYRLVENQTVWFIEKLLPNPNFIIFKIIFGLLMASFIIYWINARANRQIIAPDSINSAAKPWAKINSDLILGLGFGLAAWLAIRNFALFGLFSLPILAGNLAILPRLKILGQKLKFKILVLGLLLMTLLALFSGELQKIYPNYSNDFQLGLETNNSDAAQFFSTQKLTGPIFNNYDIGSYLIFYLYPQEKVYPERSRGVFVDNRPEAYPADFFEKIYIPMQEDENIWRQQLSRYNFKTIIFSHRDYTPWGQTFLARRLNDPEWQVVFKDERVIIFVKNTSRE